MKLIRTPWNRGISARSVTSKFLSVQLSAKDTDMKGRHASLIVLTALLLTGCMSTTTEGVKVQPEQLVHITIGQTTQAEVESLLGKPVFVRKSQGRTELHYSYVKFEQRHTGTNDLGPLLGVAPPIVGLILFEKSRQTDDDTVIIIGEDGTVTDIKRLSTDSHFTGLLVKDDYPKADMTKADQIQPGVTTEEQVAALLGAPPSQTLSLDGNTRQMQQWCCKFGQFIGLTVVYRRDGVVDEVWKTFKGCAWYPKKVDPDKVAQIREQQTNRRAAESSLGKPSGIGILTEGTFFIYSIKVGKTTEVVYIEYDSNGLVARLIRKPVPQ